MQKPPPSRSTCAIESLELRRLLFAGGFDNSFSVDGLLTTDVQGNDAPYDVAIQPDGKIVVAGSSVNPTTKRDEVSVVRYNKDGSLDRTFSPGGAEGSGRATVSGNALSSDAYGVAIQADGKIVIAGRSNVKIGKAAYDEPFLMRFTSAGQLDTTFGDRGILTLVLGKQKTGGFFCVAVQPDGRIVAGGVAQPAGSSGRGLFYRVLTDGTPDTSFGTKGIASVAATYVTQIVLDARGFIVASATGGPVPDQMAIVRLDPSGQPDPDFDGDGIAAYDSGSFADCIAVSPAGQIIIGGHKSADGWLVEAGSDGTLIKSQSAGGADVVGVAFAPDGKIVYADQAGAYGFVARDTSALVPDTDFNSSGSHPFKFTADSTQSIVSAIALQPDGKIIVVGDCIRPTSAGFDVGVARLVTYENNASSISGRVFNDLNGDGKFNGKETGLVHQVVFIDSNSNQTLDPDEAAVYSDLSGKYSIPGLAAGAGYVVREILPSGYRLSVPLSQNYYQLNLAASDNFKGIDFGDTRLALISGIVFHDNDQDGVDDLTDQILIGGYTVYADLNHDGKLSKGEPSSAAQDSIWRLNVAAGTYDIRIKPIAGLHLTTKSHFTITVKRAQMVVKRSFGVFEDP